MLFYAFSYMSTGDDGLKCKISVSILCTVENLRIDEQDCGLDFAIRLTAARR